MSRIREYLDDILLIVGNESISHDEVNKFISLLTSISDVTAGYKLNDELRDEYFTLLADALVLFIVKCDSMDDVQISNLLNLREFTASVWYLSGYRGARTPVSRIMATSNKNGTIKRQLVENLFTIVPLEALEAGWMKFIAAYPLRNRSLLIVSFLCQTGFPNSKYHENLKALIEVIKDCRADFGLDGLKLAMKAWFNVAYLELQDRVIIKDWINEFIQSKAMNNNILFEKKVSERTKPTLLVVIEVMGVDHAMGRCYLQKIRMLKDSFRVVLVADIATVTEEVLSGFEYVAVDFSEQSIPSILRRISDVDADAAYFPSVGMSPLGIILANTRIAPIQIMTGGHPDTSRSKFMDWFLIHYPEGGDGNNTEFTEKLAFTPKFLPSVGMPLSSKSLLAYKHRVGRVATVAINCKYLKLSPSFLKLLPKIKDAYGNNLRYRFFSGISAEYSRAAFEKSIRRLYDIDAVIEPKYEYAQLLRELDSCDLTLTPFPFGNTNSMADSLSLGLRTVVLRSSEVRGAGDWRTLELFGLSDCIVEDEAGYIDKAIQFLNNIRNNLDETLTRKIDFDHSEIIACLQEFSHSSHMNAPLEEVIFTSLSQ